MVHDECDIQYGGLFPWHTIYRLKKDKKIAFRKARIEFLESNHHASSDERSNLLQYIDLLLGLIYNCLHYSSHNENKVKLAYDKMYPIVKRLLYHPGNKNSRYKYVNRLAIDFFPKHRLNDLSAFQKKVFSQDGFYKERFLQIKRFIQPSLFD